MTYETQFRRLLVELIEEQILERSMSIAAGSADSFEVYKRRAGVIEGLKLSLDLASEAEKRLFGNPEEKK